MPLFNWTRVHVVPYAQDAHILKARLGLEGIEVAFEDEFTSQVHPLATSAIGGVSIMVREHHKELAIELLKSWGEFPIEPIPPSTFHRLFNWKKIDKATKWMPFLGKQEVEKRVFRSLFIVFLLLLSAVYFFQSNREDKFIFENGIWCIEYMEVGGEPVEMPEMSFVQGKSLCEDFMMVTTDQISFGNTSADGVYLRWFWDDEGPVFVVDSEEVHPLEGRYSFDFEDARLTLKSDRVIIKCVSSPSY